MTEHRRRPSQTLSVDERPLIPSVPLRGARETLDRPAGSPASAPVDGVAMIFIDPAGGDANVVFASEGLATMTGRRPDELLGRDPGELFATDGAARFAEVRRGLAIDRERLADQRAIADIRPLIAGDRFEPAQTGQVRPGLGEAGPAIDLDADDPSRSLAIGTELLRRHGRRHQDAPPRVYAAAQELARAGGRPLSVHAAYTTVPSMTPLAPYVVAEFRNLEQPSAERLLADQEAVIRSLGRGHELGRVCHQVAAQVEQELADGSRCWVAVRSGDGRLEPVLSGGLPFELVEGIVGDLLELGQPLARRVVAIGALPPERLAQLGSTSIASLWYLPLVDDDDDSAVGGAGSPGDAGLDPAGERPSTKPSPRSGPDSLRGALVVATPRTRPTRAQARALEHLAAVLDTAVEQATVEADLMHRALHDTLTGLPNRALLVDRLGQVMARLERDDLALSVLLVDIDRFKSVNDSRGAEVGDQVLQEVAGRLLTAVRLGDTVGRLAGDQYLVMCAAGKDELDATAVARRILRSLAEPIVPTDGEELHLTASIGLVVVDAPGATPAAIISNAESALARATAAGRGRMAVFEADQGHEAVERHVLEQALYSAIGAGELVIHYQPLVEIRTGFMTGAEALVRWNRPGHGLVGPGAFIPIAEESDLIVAVGAWIIERVCEDLSRWPKSRGRSPMVTINLGSRQLADDTLVPTVISALHGHGLRPRRLGFEITESVEIRDAEAAVANLNRLKDLGCRIAIDDFGIGYATLDYIRRFSMADALKIDKSFINGLGQSREDTAIVDASIALASSLGLQVIAEGVEELDQLDGLLDRGARYAQGFALAKPVPFETAIELWARQRLYDPPWERVAAPAAATDATTALPPRPPTAPRSPLPGGDLVIDLDGPDAR